MLLLEVVKLECESSCFLKLMAELIRFEIGNREIDDGDYFVVIEPVFLSVNIYDGPVRYEEDLSKFSNEQRLVLACHWYLSEVNNGGHDQFYYNSTGIVWRDTVKALAAIGAGEAVVILEESIRRLGGNPSLDRDERQEQVDRLNPQFDDLDNELFKLEESFDFDEALLEFIRAHRQKFFFSGLVEQP